MGKNSSNNDLDKDSQKEMQENIDNEQSIYCGRCGNEKWPRDLCVCGGGGGGGPEDGGEGGGGSEEKNDLKRDVFAKKPADLLVLAEELLTIEDNRGLCTLTIKCDLKSLSETQRNAVKEFVMAIKNERDNFKKRNGMSNHDCVVKDKINEEGTLTINFPNIKDIKLYAEFINQLESKNLLPAHHVAHDKNEMASATHKQSSPYDSIKQGPKPKG